MNLLNNIEACRICPICGKESLPVLRVSYDDHSKVDYTLVKCEYPLIYSKLLDFGGVPKDISISADDILNCGQPIYSASMRIHCDHHYNCDLFNITKSRLPKTMFNRIHIESAIQKTIRVAVRKTIKVCDNYIIMETPSHTKILKNGREILDFKKQFNIECWHIKDINAFEEKINKLLLLK